jgi:hypothetical protein
MEAKLSSGSFWCLYCKAWVDTYTEAQLKEYIEHHAEHRVKKDKVSWSENVSKTRGRL